LWPHVSASEPTLDFLSAADADLEGVPDDEVLALATVEDRISVTHDIKTMPLHFGNFVESGHHSPGVFLVSQQQPVSVVAEELVLIWAASDGSEWATGFSIFRFDVRPNARHTSTRQVAD
jgi:Domain of unknown function (DUF5615)